MNSLLAYGNYYWNREKWQWCWSYNYLRNCKPCDPNPTPSGAYRALLDQSMYMYNNNSHFEYGPGNGKSDNKGHADYVVYDDKRYYYRDGVNEIDCWWLVQNSIDALNETLR